MNKIIIFPTDTVYGIGTSLYNKKGIEKIYKIKGRNFNKPISVLCSNIEQIKTFAVLNEDAIKLANHFWPGELTLILKTNEKYFKYSNEKTIGVRIPNNDIALSLIKKFGPLKTTSINESGKEPLNNINIIKDIYKDKVDLIFENSSSNISKVSSTVLDLTNKLNIIRLGNIKKSDILNILNNS